MLCSMHIVTIGVTNFVLVATSHNIEVRFVKVTQQVQICLYRLIRLLIKQQTFTFSPVSCYAGCLCAVSQDVNIEFCQLLVNQYVGPLMTQVYVG